MEDDYYEDDYYDHYDSGMSYAQQAACDRREYADEMVRAGKWSQEQASEYIMGA
jgi:polyhydroxyalkanoate synthesis regulator phasin